MGAMKGTQVGAVFSWAVGASAGSVPWGLYRRELGSFLSENTPLCAGVWSSVEFHQNESLKV